MSRTSGSDLPRALQEFRASCPLVEKSIYLASNSQAPKSKPVQAGLAQFMDSWATLRMHWNSWMEEVEHARQSFAARAGIELVRQTGVAAMQTQIDRLSSLAYQAPPARGLKILGPQPGTPKGATTAIDAGSPEQAHWLEDALCKRGVIASARGEAVRLAPHGFTLESELEQAFDILAQLLVGAPDEKALR